MSIKLRVYGTPASQGSKRWLPNGRMIEADTKIKPWRSSVHAAVLNVNANGLNLESPMQVRVTFLFARPKAHYRTGKNSNLLREGAPFYVTRTPDLDKCLRALLDPITEMAVWKDDSQVVQIDSVKRYCGDGEVPGAIVEIIPMPSHY